MLLLTLLLACAPSTWRECYPGADAFDGVQLQGTPVSVMWCEPEYQTCSDTGWYYDDEAVYVYRLNPDETGDGGEVCVVWWSE